MNLENIDHIPKIESEERKFYTRKEIEDAASFSESLLLEFFNSITEQLLKKIGESKIINVEDLTAPERHVLGLLVSEHNVVMPELFDKRERAHRVKNSKKGIEII